MPILWLLLTLLFVNAVIHDAVLSNDEKIIAQGEVAAISDSILVYRSFVTTFAENNPAFVGPAGDAQLGVPVWYVRPNGINNYIVGGKGYVYYTNALPGLAGNLAVRLESTTVGTNNGGVLYSPNTGNTGIVLPAQIPVSSTVIVQ